MFEKIGDNFAFDASIFDLVILDTLPIVYHTYGSQTQIPDELCWMSYAGTEGGEISFTRNTHIYLPEVAKYVTAYMQQFVKIDLQLLPERIHFIRTRGTVNPHRDEPSRKCCLNIGLKNSNSAITNIADTENISEFLKGHDSYTCEDGSMYLLDTSRIHSVEGDPNVSRLLLTYGFTRDFKTIRSILK